MDSNSIQVKLSVEQNDNAIIAHLVFRNNSVRKILLDKQTIYYDGEVRNNYFEIRNDANKEVSYRGRMINCTLLPEDFIELAEGDEIKSSIPLNEFYKMAQGNKYVIQYYAFNPSPEKGAELIEMQSNSVKISY
jgi:hypothetical protein